jgi:hypothetical protein
MVIDSRTSTQVILAANLKPPAISLESEAMTSMHGRVSRKEK